MASGGMASGAMAAVEVNHSMSSVAAFAGARKNAFVGFAELLVQNAQYLRMLVLAVAPAAGAAVAAQLG